MLAWVVACIHLQIPRQGSLQLLCYTSLPDLGLCSWLPLLTFHVNPQSQHIVDIGWVLEKLSNNKKKKKKSVSLVAVSVHRLSK